eukprot:TRINITY_DN1657_c0_g1_i4.p1 TRINITY_DN1657_c0_g1~~TRINITY_DN1657_c0_g1_i4.p1  ORF type:complete len:555 (+),score=122.23 TRINITY_DN1657_c0_g1_i4:10-1674(+)
MSTILVLFAVSLAQTESPAPLANPGGRCVPYAGRVCADVIPAGSSVFLFANDTIASIEATGGTLDVYNQLLAAVLTVNQACGQLAKKQVCAAGFPPCNTDHAVPLPEMPCRTLCESTNAACEALFSQFGQPVTDCAGELETWLHQYHQWADGSTTFPAGSTPCNDGSAYTDAEATCHWPLGAKDGVCVEVCGHEAAHTADPDNYPANLKAQYVVGFLSFFCSLFMVMTWVLFPKKRKFPSTMILYLSINSLFVSVSFLMQHWNPHESKCKDSVTQQTPSDAGCFLQYWFIQYNSLSLAFWWMFIAINLFLQVVIELKTAANLQMIYHPIAWGLPFILAIVPLGMRIVRYQNWVTFCWIDDPPKRYLDAFYFSWIMLVIIVGSICMLAVSAKIFLVTWKTARQDKSGKLGRKLAAQIRTLFFIGAFVVIYAVVYAVKVQFENTYDESTTRVFEFSVCNAASPGQCKLDLPVSLGLFYLQSYLVNFQGFVVFLMFGLTKDTMECYSGKVAILLGFFSHTGTTHAPTGTVTSKEFTTDTNTASPHHHKHTVEELERF